MQLPLHFGHLSNKKIKGGAKNAENFQLEDLDCANCAAKMEEGIRKIEGVQSATVSFMAQKLILEADDSRFDEIVQKAVQVCKKIEPDCTVKV